MIRSIINQDAALKSLFAATFLWQVGLSYLLRWYYKLRYKIIYRKDIKKWKHTHKK